MRLRKREDTAAICLNDKPMRHTASYAQDGLRQAGGRPNVGPMMEQAEETTGTKAQTTLADAGYFAGSHLEECASRGQQVVVSEARQRFPRTRITRTDSPMRAERQLYVPTGADARLTACERSPIATVPGLSPSVSARPSESVRQGDWAVDGPEWQPPQARQEA